MTSAIKEILKDVELNTPGKGTEENKENIGDDESIDEDNNDNDDSSYEEFITRSPTWLGSSLCTWFITRSPTWLGSSLCTWFITTHLVHH
jgi:hypothetical protein